MTETQMETVLERMTETEPEAAVVDEYPFKWIARYKPYGREEWRSGRRNGPEIYYLTSKDSWILPNCTEAKYSQVLAYGESNRHWFGKSYLSEVKADWSIQYAEPLAGLECGHWQISRKAAVLVYGDEAQPIEPEQTISEQTYCFLCDVFGKEKALVFLHWLSEAVNRKYLTTKILILVGDADTGRFIQKEIITPLVGGRSHRF
jgi:hypothetical protein